MERLVRARVEKGRVAIHWLGQSGFALKPHSGDVVVVDPYLSDSANRDGGAPRLADVPVKPKDVRLDYLFLTHDHVDHTDPHTAPAIAQANPQAPVVCPPSSCRHLSKLGVPGSQMRTAMPGQILEFPHFTVHVVTAQHTEDSVGYVFSFAGPDTESSAVVVYTTGDTEYSDGLAAAVEDLGPDVLLVPIGGRPGNLDAAQAARLTREIGPREVIPMHWGLFEEDTADADDFVGLLAGETGSDAQIVPVVMRHNTCHIFCPNETAQGRQGQKQARAARARQARSGHEHHDGVRGPGGGGRLR